MPHQSQITGKSSICLTGEQQRKLKFQRPFACLIQLVVTLGHQWITWRHLRAWQRTSKQNKNTNHKNSRNSKVPIQHYYSVYTSTSLRGHSHIHIHYSNEGLEKPRWKTLTTSSIFVVKTPFKFWTYMIFVGHGYALQMIFWTLINNLVWMLVSPSKERKSIGTNQTQVSAHQRIPKLLRWYNISDFQMTDS